MSYTNVLDCVPHENIEYLLNRKMKQCTEQMNKITKWIYLVIYLEQMSHEY